MFCVGYNLFSDNSFCSTMTARYLNDLWAFDTQEYKWTQVELKETDSKPSYVIEFTFSFFFFRNLHLGLDREAGFPSFHMQMA